jgi:hypothetical protein
MNHSVRMKALTMPVRPPARKSQRDQALCMHRRSLLTSTAITSWYIPGLIAPLDAIRVFNRSGITFMLIGSHARGGWMDEPRASNDVDFLIAQRHHRKAVLALVHAFPRLQIAEDGRVTRLCDPSANKHPLVDLWRPFCSIFRMALRHRHTVRLEKQEFAVPTVELDMALCYARFVDLPWSDAEKYQVTHDIMLLAGVNPDIDLDKLAALGDHAFLGAGKRIVAKVKAIQQGKKVRW